MKANPGGVIAPQNVYGRSHLIGSLWERLDPLCVLMNAERRIGKTSVLRKMTQSGSIGLHHVLDSIRDGKMSSEPVNDMQPVEVPPLAREDAVALAADLIEGGNLRASDPRQSSEVIAEEADDVPFYIHHIVGVWSECHLPPDEEGERRNRSVSMKKCAGWPSSGAKI